MEAREGERSGVDGSISVQRDGGSKGNAVMEASVEEKYASLRCMDLMAEWRRCISAYHQFHQYYIYGHYSHCKEEKEKMYNCIKWKTFGKEEARTALVQRLEAEQKAMQTPNPVWEMRKSPPSDW